MRTRLRALPNDRPWSDAEVLTHTDADAIHARLDAMTDPDWPQRDEHVQLITTLIARVKLIAENRSTTR